jgi:hypothetical protein
MHERDESITATSEETETSMHIDWGYIWDNMLPLDICDSKAKDQIADAVGTWLADRSRRRVVYAE